MDPGLESKNFKNSQLLQTENKLRRQRIGQCHMLSSWPKLAPAVFFPSTPFSMLRTLAAILLSPPRFFVNRGGSVQIPENPRCLLWPRLPPALHGAPASLYLLLAQGCWECCFGTLQNRGLEEAVDWLGHKPRSQEAATLKV